MTDTSKSTSDPSSERRGTVYLPRVQKPMFVSLTRARAGHRKKEIMVNMVHVVDIEQYNDGMTILHLSDGSDTLVVESPEKIASMLPEDCVL